MTELGRAARHQRIYQTEERGGFTWRSPLLPGVRAREPGREREPVPGRPPRDEPVRGGLGNSPRVPPAERMDVS